MATIKTRPLGSLLAVPALHLKRLTVQREIEFVCELLGIEGAAGEEAVADLKGGDFALAVVHAEDQVFSVGIVFNVDFADFDAAFFQKRFGTAAIGAPGGGVHDDGGSWSVGHLGLMV